MTTSTNASISSVSSIYAVSRKAALVLAAVAVAHAAVWAPSAAAMQSTADAAVKPALQIVKAEPIVIRSERSAKTSLNGLQVVKAERITITGTAPAMQVVKAERIEIVGRAA